MESNAAHIEVYRALRESQTRHTYFLLAAAGAGIGFAVSQTTTATLHWSQVPLGLAVLSWGLSFVFGCRHVAYVSSTLYANAELFDVQTGVHRDLITRHPEEIAATSAGLTLAMEHNAKKSNQFGHLQFNWLVAGAISFVAWHVLEMYLRGRCV